MRVGKELRERKNREEIEEKNPLYLLHVSDSLIASREHKLTYLM